MTLDEIFAEYTEEELKKAQIEMHQIAQQIEKELGKPVGREVI